MERLEKLCICLVLGMITLHGVKAALIGTCASDEDCKGQNGDLNAVCSPDEGSGQKCICTGAFKNNKDNDGCVPKVLGDTCDDDSDCTRTDDSICSTDGNCDCKSNYIKDGTACKKVLGGTCGGNTDCTGTVENSVCTGGNCVCEANYLEENAGCKKVLGGTCSDNTDCTGKVDNSVCTGGNCECEANYIEESEACKKAAVTDVTCDEGDEDCTVENSECDGAETSPKCKCSDGYEKDSNDGSTCVKPAESSATSAWMTTSMLVTSMLIYLTRFILL